MSETDSIKRKFEEISTMINYGKYKGALELLTQLESLYPDNKYIQFNKPITLIQIGSGLKDIILIKKEIDVLENWLPKIKEEDICALFHFNTANGYLSLYDILRTDIKKNIKLFFEMEYLQKAKRHLRDALKSNKNLSQGLKLQIHTNYGNCLDHLGRGLEALYAYDEALKIDSSFGMALGNKAITLQNFADIAGKYRGATYVEAYQIFERIVNDPKIIKIGTISAKIDFKKKMGNIENLIKDKTQLSKSLKHKRYSEEGLTNFEKFYLDFCSRNKLFLNFHILDHTCDVAVIDSVFIRTISDKETFFRLTKIINQIKEDYATARLLLVQSIYRRDDFNRISKRTTLINTMDYSAFHIYSGLLKTAYRIGYNIFDKIAFFIKDYLDLKMEGKRIYFYTIWQSNKKVKEPIINTKNISLFALYDIYLDFQNDECYNQLRKIRNSLVHRTLTIYDSRMTKDYDENSDDKNIGWDTMFNKTIEMMFLVKCATVYLINFVELEERKKREKYKDAKIGTVYADSTQLL